MQIVTADDRDIAIEKLRCEVASEYWWENEILYEAGPYREINPLEAPQNVAQLKKDRLEPAFVAFAKLAGTPEISPSPPSPESFVEFAKRYGRIWPLSQAGRTAIRCGLPLSSKDALQKLDLWRTECHYIRLAYDILSGKKQRIEGLVMRGDADPETWSPGRDILAWLETTTDVEEAAEDLKKSDEIFLLINPVEYPEQFRVPLFHHEVKDCATKVSEAMLLKIWLAKFITRNMRRVGVEFALTYIAAKDRALPLVHPDTLLGAMWWQLSEALAGHRKYKPCEYCGKLQDVTEYRAHWTGHPECKNSDAVTKTRKWPKIEKLLNEGYSIKDIAKKTKRSEEEIERWKRQGDKRKGEEPSQKEENQYGRTRNAKRTL